MTTAPTSSDTLLKTLRDKREDNVCVVNPAGELLALASREYFRDLRK